MRYLISLILFFALVNPCHAWMMIGEGESIGAPPPESAFCDSCPDAANGADVACEDLEPTGYECSSPAWTENLDGGTINEDNVPTGTWICTDANTKNVQVVFAGATYTRLDNGSEIAHSYGIFYFKLISENIDNNSYLFAIQDGSSVVAAVGQLIQDATGIYLTIGQRNDSNTTTYQTVGSPDYITSSDVVRVIWDHDATTGSGVGSWKVRVGSGGIERTISFDEDGTDDGHGFQYLVLGYISDDENYTAEFDFIKVDDDAAPAICTGDS